MHLVTLRAGARWALTGLIAAACNSTPVPVTGVPAAPRGAKEPSMAGGTRGASAAGRTGRPGRGSDSAGVAAARALPPVPFVDGPLQLRVIYPLPNHAIAARDSNFIFGSTGSGAASLSINHEAIPVYPNGAFLAWLPVPTADRPRYDLSATKGSEVASISLPVSVRAPLLMLADTGKLEVDHASVAPAGRLLLRPEERVRVAIRAPQNAYVVLRASSGSSHVLSRSSGRTWTTEVAARELAQGGSILVLRRGDSVEVKTAAVRLLGPDSSRFATLLNADVAARSDTDQASILRPTPEGTYKWFLFPGTELEITGQRGDYLRVRLDDQLEAWVEEKAVRPLVASPAAPRRIAANAHVTTRRGFSDLRIPVSQRPAFLVEEQSEQLGLTLYGVISNVDNMNFATNDPSIRDVTWEQVTSDRVRFTVTLRHEPYGYLVLWERGELVLRVRHPPDVNGDRPLEGRVIAIDPGHPPAGATGPTGLYEGDAVLAVAEQLKPMLESRGATVVMTRTTSDAVPLGERVIAARRANAEVLVSIHLNALPDGANPLRLNGTGTYFFHHHAESLARAVQRGLVRHLGLRDMGVNYDNLALVRATWLPAILCEGAFVIVPEQEAALRTVAFQRRYAQGIVDGLEEFFAGIAGTSVRK